MHLGSTFLSRLRMMLVGIWLGLYWVLFSFFDYYIKLMKLWASLKTPQIENTMVSTFFITEFTIQKCTSEPHCISWTDIDMGKTISTFLYYYFLISFITSFSPKRFMQALRNSTFVWAPSAGTIELCTIFFNAQIKCFGEKDVMNEIKK